MPLPVKLFDVRTGDGAVRAGETYPDATLIVFRDGPAKIKILNAFAKANNYQENVPDPANPGGPLIPNPQNKATFFRQVLTDLIKQTYRDVEAVTAAKTASDTARAAAEAEL